MKVDTISVRYEDWVDYWSKDDFWRDSYLWQINSKLFFKNVKRIIEFKKSDCVLDIGCGAGHTEILLAPLVKSIHAVDIAQQFVNTCSERCKNHNNVSVDLLKKDDYTNLEILKGPFSVILCVSVVQYYKNVSEIEALISSAQKIASPGAQMLIVDLPLERQIPGFIWDMFCSCLLSIREGYSQTLLSTAFKRWLCRTSYKGFYDRTEQLYFTTKKLESLINRLNLNAKIIQGNFSVYANRLSLLIKF